MTKYIYVLPLALLVLIQEYTEAKPKHDSNNFLLTQLAKLIPLKLAKNLNKQL